MKPVCEIITNQDGKPSGIIIFCPACKEGHVFDSRWNFNDNFEKPTFKPSMLVYGNEETLKRTGGKHGHRCHSFVTDGKIQFLGDCTHDMKNQTVELNELWSKT